MLPERVERARRLLVRTPSPSSEELLTEEAMARRQDRLRAPTCEEVMMRRRGHLQAPADADAGGGSTTYVASSSKVTCEVALR